MIQSDRDVMMGQIANWHLSKKEEKQTEEYTCLNDDWVNMNGMM